MTALARVQGQLDTRSVALRVAAIYVAARLVTTFFFWTATLFSTEASRFGAHPSLATFALGWDAQWYARIAEDGYPAKLPVDQQGNISQNGWAFMPLYAALAKGLSWITGSWGFSAILISIVAGYLACLVLYKIVRETQSDKTASWAVLLFAAGPLAAVFQIAYAESLFLLWLFLAIFALQRRRYGWVYLLIPLMGYTRPGVLAFALFLGLFGIWRFVSRRREALSLRECGHIVALGALATIVGFSWQFFAAWTTGMPDAYLQTELSWRRGWGAVGEHFLPFEGWIKGIAFWFSQWGLGIPAAYLALILSVLLLIVLFRSGAMRAQGPEISLWSVSYLVYLTAVFFPQSSTFRLLLPLAPLTGAVAAAPRYVRYAALGGGLLFQWLWIIGMYAAGNTYWLIP